MECSQAVLMLMLLVPCEQSGGNPAETVIAERPEAPAVVQVEPRLVGPLEVAPAPPATDTVAVSARPATDVSAEPSERAATGDRRVSD